MSYILDALKKAESERNLGAVPGVHATTLDAGAQTDESSLLRKSLPWLLVILMGLCMLAYVLWSHNDTKAPSEQTAPAIAKAPEAAASPPAPPAEQKAEEPKAAAPAVEKAPAAPVSAPNPAIAKPAKPEPKTAAQIPVAPPAPAKNKAVSAPQATASADTPAPVDAAKSDDQNVGTLQDLPANIQRELPPVSVNGYIYARNPADRSVLMNKRLLHEGETVAPDLVLEKLLPKGAILNYKGYRYRVAF